MKISSFFTSMPTTISTSTTTRIRTSSPPPPSPPPPSPPSSTHYEPLPWSSDLFFISDHSDPFSFIFNDEEEKEGKEEPLLARKNNSFPRTMRKEKHCLYNQPSSWSTATEENYPMTTTPPPWFNYTVDESLHGGYYSDVFEGDQNPVCDFTSCISESRKVLNSSHFSSGGEVNEGISEKVSSLCSENTCRSRGRKRRGKGGGEKEESEEGNSDYEVEEEDDCVGGRKGAFSAVSASVRVGSGSKRSRAAEVHNLSERRRRDRINEKMKALQELIPNCNKVDKASMLDEAIEYLKTLQLQVQMMMVGTTGMCMSPLMFHPGAVSHFPYFNFGMGDGAGGSGIVDMGSEVMGGQVFQPSLVQGPHQGRSFMSHERMMGEALVHLPSPSIPLPNSTPPLSLVHPSQTFIHGGGVEASNCGVPLCNKNMGFRAIDTGDVIQMSCQGKDKAFSSESDLVKGRC